MGILKELMEMDRYNGEPDDPPDLDADQKTIEDWFRGYGLLAPDQHLTPQQLAWFYNHYNTDRADDIDNGDDFYEWMKDAALAMKLR